MADRNWQELIAAAEATGTYNQYQGDGASIPWQIGREYAKWIGHTMLAYKAHLDFEYPDAFKLHDWCYTPYGRLIGVTRSEADVALAEMIQIRRGNGPPPRNTQTAESTLDSLVVGLAVRSYGGPWFGSSTTGWDPGQWHRIGQPKVEGLAEAVLDQQLFLAVNAPIWRLPAMPVYKYTVGLQRIEGKPAAGFSETWYFNAGTDSEAKSRANDYVSERAKILSKSWQVGTFTRLAVLAANCKRFKPQGKTKFCCVPRVESRVQCVCPAPLAGKIAVDSDQNWDGLLVEMCTNPIAHTGCAKCELQTKPFVRQQILRGIPDTWYSGGLPAINATDQGKVRTFMNYLKTSMIAGSVGCSDDCSDDDDTACTSVVFAPFTDYCPRFDQIHKRNTGRPFGLGRGRRSKRKAA